MKATTMKTPALWKKGTGMIIRQLNKILCSLVAVTLTVTSVSAVAGETIRYVHTDHLGTPVVWTDENGNVVKTSEYEPYGLQVSGPVEDGPGYTGHVEDAATGLTYMQQRYYDPGIGMFLSVDPVTAYNSPVGQFNRYRYANGNPYLYTDPDGRSGTLILVAPELLPAPPPVVMVGAVAVGSYAVGTLIYESNATAIQDGLDAVFNESAASDNSDPLDKVLDGATPGRETKGRTTNWEKGGGSDQANKDFDQLVPDGGEPIDGMEGARKGVTEDGRNVNVRPTSSDGRPTVEVQDGKNRTKIRYD